MLKGHSRDPYIININAKATEMLLRLDSVTRRRVDSPDPLHYFCVAVSCRSLYGADELQCIVLDELTARRTPLRVGGGCHSKPRFDFTQSDRTHPNNVLMVSCLQTLHEYRILFFPRDQMISVEQVSGQLVLLLIAGPLEQLRHSRTGEFLIKIFAQMHKHI